MEEEAFRGFTPAGLRFLRDLKENNDREWFRARKEAFETLVKRPMELLAADVGARCRKRGLTIRPKEKNPVTRIYRDIRFSADKRPFNTHIGAALKSARANAGYGEVYIHVSAEQSLVAAGFWMPERQFLSAWRERMAADPAAFLRVVKALKKAGLELSTENALKRLPRGFDKYADSPVADALKLASYVVSRTLTEQECGSPELIDLVCQFAIAAKPLLEYGWKIDYRAKRDILEQM